MASSPAGMVHSGGRSLARSSIVSTLGRYASSTAFCGRGLYETMLVWETDPSLRDNELRAAFADVWSAIPKVVFSHTLDSVQGNARLVKAEAFAAEHSTVPASTRGTFRSGLDTFLRYGEREKGLRGSTLHKYRRIAERLADRPWRSGCTWADRVLDTFNEDDLLNVRRELVNAGRSADTLNHHRRVIRLRSRCRPLGGRLQHPRRLCGQQGPAHPLRSDERECAAGAVAALPGQGRRRVGLQRRSRPGEPIVAADLYRRFINAGKRAGLPRLSFHELRHTFGTQAIRKFKIHEVQRMMGHRHITTTERYLHYAPDADGAAKLTELWGDRGGRGRDAPPSAPANVVPLRRVA